MTSVTETSSDVRIQVLRVRFAEESQRLTLHAAEGTLRRVSRLLVVAAAVEQDNERVLIGQAALKPRRSRELALVEQALKRDVHVRQISYSSPLEIALYFPIVATTLGLGFQVVRLYERALRAAMTKSEKDAKLRTDDAESDARARTVRAQADAEVAKAELEAAAYRVMRDELGLAPINSAEKTRFDDADPLSLEGRQHVNAAIGILGSLRSVEATTVETTEQVDRLISDGE